MAWEGSWHDRDLILSPPNLRLYLHFSRSEPVNPSTLLFCWSWLDLPFFAALEIKGILTPWTLFFSGVPKFFCEEGPGTALIKPLDLLILSMMANFIDFLLSCIHWSPGDPNSFQSWVRIRHVKWKKGIEMLANQHSWSLKVIVEWCEKPITLFLWTRHVVWMQGFLAERTSVLGIQAPSIPVSGSRE